MPSAGMDSPPDGPKARFNNEPVLKQPFGEQIHGVCFSPFEWSHELLLVVFHNKVLVAEVRTDVGDDAEPDVKVIGNLNHAVQCRRVAVSPASSLAVAPKLVQFATAGADNRVRVFRSDLAHDNTCHVLAGHADAINDLSYDCETNYLASASDDHTARVWDADTCLVTFCLRSPAVAVCWHQDDCAKLMVCERSGLIRCYNVQSQQPILSVDNGSLLSSAHWSPSDSQLLAALAHGHLKLWDLTRPSRPTNVLVVNVEDGGDIKFNQDGNYIAVISPLSFGLKVVQPETNQVKLSAPVLLPTNVTWHFRLPLVCIGDDRHLCFWRIETN